MALPDWRSPPRRLLLNTSFNNNAEPIVETVDDAVGCYLTTGLDFLVVGEYLVRRTPHADRLTSYGHLAPSLTRSRRLVSRQRPEGARDGTPAEHLLESMRSSFFGPLDIPISPEMARVLAFADGRTQFSALMTAACIDRAASDALYAEAHRLWSARGIVLHPPVRSSVR